MAVSIEYLRSLVNRLDFCRDQWPHWEFGRACSEAAEVIRALEYDLRLATGGDADAEPLAETTPEQRKAMFVPEGL
jgi:hypothetical protein